MHLHLDPSRTNKVPFHWLYFSLLVYTRWLGVPRSFCILQVSLQMETESVKKGITCTTNINGNDNFIGLSKIFNILAAAVTIIRVNLNGNNNDLELYVYSASHYYWQLPKIQIWITENFHWSTEHHFCKRGDHAKCNSLPKVCSIWFSTRNFWNFDCMVHVRFPNFRNYPKKISYLLPSFERFRQFG